jgi:hypothetical protein
MIDATKNPGYPNAYVRRQINEEAEGDVRRGMLELTGKFDQYLLHQYYIRDMAVFCIESGDIEQAKQWLNKIGKG